MIGVTRQQLVGLDAQLTQLMAAAKSCDAAAFKRLVRWPLRWQVASGYDPLEDPSKRSAVKNVRALVKRCKSVDDANLEAPSSLELALAGLTEPERPNEIAVRDSEDESAVWSLGWSPGGWKLHEVLIFRQDTQLTRPHVEARAPPSRP